jgi:hypothetical protein
MSSMTSELTHEQRLARTGITLPDALPAFGQYVPAVQHGTTLWVGGHFGTRPDGSTRLAVGVASLPANLVLEIQALLIVTPVSPCPTLRP